MIIPGAALSSFPKFFHLFNSRQYRAQAADVRVEAYHKGEIDAIPAEDVFVKYRRK